MGFGMHRLVPDFPVMNVDEFWALIEESGRHGSYADERAEWLAETLAQRPTEEIVEFQLRQAEVKKAADTWQMWGAAYRVCRGWCSEDVFWYFQSWLIGLGREAFERVTVDPDALADVPAVLRQLNLEDDDEWQEPQWEALDYVAEDAYERATGGEQALADVLEERGIELAVDPSPPDDDLPGGQAEHASRLPRLSALFPDEDLIIP